MSSGSVCRFASLVLRTKVMDSQQDGEGAPLAHDALHAEVTAANQAQLPIDVQPQADATIISVCIRPDLLTSMIFLVLRIFGVHSIRGGRLPGFFQSRTGLSRLTIYESLPIMHN